MLKHEMIKNPSQIKKIVEKFVLVLAFFFNCGTDVRKLRVHHVPESVLSVI